MTAEDDEFAGLMTMSNSVPARSAELTIEDLIKAMDEFPKYADEQMAKHEEFILNQDRWQQMIMNDHRAGRTDRMNDLLMSMRLGLDPIQGYGYPQCFLDELKTPRFRRLRKRLYKAVFK